MNKSLNKKLGIFWWRFLFIISLFNIIINIYYYNKVTLPDNKLYLFKLVLIYTFVCGIRALFPKKDVSGVCFYNSIFSYPIFGRFLATFAEISIIIFISNIFKAINNEITSNENMSFIYNLLIIFIIIAQLFCWLGAITKCYLYNSIEESIWTISGLVITIINIYLLKFNNSKYQNFLKLAIVFGICYLYYMISFDVPMYINKYKSSYNRKKLGIIKGLSSMCKCTKVTRLYTDWKSEIFWQTGYFSICVWMTLYILLWYQNHL